MTSRADRLLCCAVAYRNAQGDGPSTLPETFENEGVGVAAMMSVLWHGGEYRRPSAILRLIPSAASATFLRMAASLASMLAGCSSSSKRPSRPAVPRPLQMPQRLAAHLW